MTPYGVGPAECAGLLGGKKEGLKIRQIMTFTVHFYKRHMGILVLLEFEISPTVVRAWCRAATRDLLKKSCPEPKAG